MKFLSDIDTAARIKNVPAGTIAATNVQSAINELDDTIQALGSSGTAATKVGTASFPGGGTTDVVTDAFITVNTFVVISPTGTKVGEWTVEAAAGSFTVTSDSTEAATATYDWGAFLDGTAASAGNELTALQALADTAGFVKKTGDGAYAIDTATYGTSNVAVANLSGTAETIGGSAVVGVAATAARSDHKHAIAAPSWKGTLVGCMGDGDPNQLLQSMSSGTIIEATPTLITTSLARSCYFKLDTAITFNKVRYFGIGATTTIYQLALYNADTLARLWTSGTFTTSSQAWAALGSALNITLAANQLYFIAVSANATGTTAGIKCFGATTGRLGVLPKTWPGSLDVDSSIITPYGAQGQFAVTTGALVDPANTIAALGSMACGMPAIFLDSNNA
jgi:hypothetical protein